MELVHTLLDLTLDELQPKSARIRAAKTISQGLELTNSALAALDEAGGALLGVLHAEVAAGAALERAVLDVCQLGSLAESAAHRSSAVRAACACADVQQPPTALFDFLSSCDLIGLGVEPELAQMLPRLLEVLFAVLLAEPRGQPTQSVERSAAAACLRNVLVRDAGLYEVIGLRPICTDHLEGTVQALQALSQRQDRSEEENEVAEDMAVACLEIVSALADELSPRAITCLVPCLRRLVSRSGRYYAAAVAALSCATGLLSSQVELEGVHASDLADAFLDAGALDALVEFLAAHRSSGAESAGSVRSAVELLCAICECSDEACVHIFPTALPELLRVTRWVAKVDCLVLQNTADEASGCEAVAECLSCVTEMWRAILRQGSFSLEDEQAPAVVAKIADAIELLAAQHTRLLQQQIAGAGRAIERKQASDTNDWFGPAEQFVQEEANVRFMDSLADALCAWLGWTHTRSVVSASRAIAAVEKFAGESLCVQTPSTRLRLNLQAASAALPLIELVTDTAQWSRVLAIAASVVAASITDTRYENKSAAVKLLNDLLHLVPRELKAEVGSRLVDEGCIHLALDVSAACDEFNCDTGVVNSFLARLLMLSLDAGVEPSHDSHHGRLLHFYEASGGANPNLADVSEVMSSRHAPESKQAQALLIECWIQLSLWERNQLLSAQIHEDISAGLSSLVEHHDAATYADDDALLSRLIALAANHGDDRATRWVERAFSARSLELERLDLPLRNVVVSWIFARMPMPQLSEYLVQWLSTQPLETDPSAQTIMSEQRAIECALQVLHASQANSETEMLVLRFLQSCAQAMPATLPVIALNLWSLRSHLVSTAADLSPRRIESCLATVSLCRDVALSGAPFGNDQEVVLTKSAATVLCQLQLNEGTMVEAPEFPQLVLECLNFCTLLVSRAGLRGDPSAAVAVRVPFRDMQHKLNAAIDSYGAEPAAADAAICGAILSFKVALLTFDGAHYARIGDNGCNASLSSLETLGLLIECGAPAVQTLAVTWLGASCQLARQLTQDQSGAQVPPEGAELVQDIHLMVTNMVLLGSTSPHSVRAAMRCLREMLLLKDIDLEPGWPSFVATIFRDLLLLRAGYAFDGLHIPSPKLNEDVMPTIDTAIASAYTAAAVERWPLEIGEACFAEPLLGELVGWLLALPPESAVAFGPIFGALLRGKAASSTLEHELTECINRLGAKSSPMDSDEQKDREDPCGLLLDGIYVHELLLDAAQMRHAVSC